MGSFVRILTAPSALPTAIASPAVSSSSSYRLPIKLSFPPFSSLRSATRLNTPNAIQTPTHPEIGSTASEMKPADPQAGAILPELTTEFMVDMKCEDCVSSVKNNLLKLDGVKSIDVDLSNQVVRVLGPLPAKTMLDALEQTERKTRLIGQGNPNDFLVSAAVAEFKGPVIFGVVRLAQVNMELARIEATFSGLSSGKHGWAINKFGDLTRGATSTGKVYNPTDQSSGTVKE